MHVLIYIYKMYVGTYVHILYIQSRLAVIRVPEWITSTLESTISTLAEVSNQSLVFH